MLELTPAKPLTLAQLTEAVNGVRDQPRHTEEVKRLLDRHGAALRSLIAFAVGETVGYTSPPPNLTGAGREHNEPYAKHNSKYIRQPRPCEAWR